MFFNVIMIMEDKIYWENKDNMIYICSKIKMLIMVKYVILGLFMLGRDLNNGFIRMIIINISDVE